MRVNYLSKTEKNLTYEGEFLRVVTETTPCEVFNVILSSFVILLLPLRSRVLHNACS